MNTDNSHISFGEALLANTDALDKYLRLPIHLQEEIVDRAQSIDSSAAMRAFVEKIMNID